MHVVTVNDYLAKRDAEEMGKIHEFLGLTVGVVLNDMKQIKTGFLRISLKTGKLSKNIIHRSKRLYMGDLLKTVYIK